MKNLIYLLVRPAVMQTIYQYMIHLPEIQKKKQIINK